MATVDVGLVSLYTAQYSTNLQLLLQQKGSKLRGKVMEGSHTGKMASPVQYITPISMKTPKGLFAPKTNTESQYVRRWVFPVPGDINQLLDTFQQLETIVDPKSQFATNAAYAVGRGWDDSIIANATGTAYTGVDVGALVTETFNTTNFQVSSSFQASAATGLTVQKMIEMKRIFRHYHVDLESDEITLLIGSQQEADLLNQATVVSTDYNDRPVLVDGKIQRYLGMSIVVSERLSQATAGSVRTCVGFVKSGQYLGIWKDMSNRVSQRNDLSGEPWQIYTDTMFGATRLEPGRTIEILCADTTGVDITP